MTGQTKPQIEIHRFATEPDWTYSRVDEYQRSLVAKVAAGEPGRVILSELPPTVTLTQRTPDEDLLLSRDEINQRGVSIETTDRGGLATYHGPGQWVLYWVESLEKLTGDRRGVRQAVELLLRLGASAAEALGAPGVHLRDGDERGVWTDRGKVASVGVRVTQGVLIHGLCLNVFATEQSFTGIRPCGLDTRMVYLADEQDLDPQTAEDWMVRAQDALVRAVEAEA